MRRCPSEACGFRFVAFQSQSQGSYYHHVALCGRHPQTCFEHSANCICRPAKISCHTVSLVYASESNNLNWNWNYFNSNWNNFNDNTKILNWICNYINWNWNYCNSNWNYCQSNWQIPIGERIGYGLSHTQTHKLTDIIVFTCRCWGLVKMSYTHSLMADRTKRLEGLWSKKLASHHPLPL